LVCANNRCQDLLQFQVKSKKFKFNLPIFEKKTFSYLIFDEILGGFNVEIEFFISREAKCFGKKDLIL